MSSTLFPHNKAAYDAACKMMKETGKAAIVHPTGTGKSFIAFHLALEHPDKCICWLSPSEYIYKTQVENFAAVNDGGAPQNIQFFTYAKLSLLSPAELEAICPDFIILDEFHRCGAQVWGAGVQRLLQCNPDIPVLGLSATNIRYLDSQRDMADELFDGNVASYISLGEALVRDILHAPTYVQTVYSYQKSLEKIAGRVYRAKSRAVRDKAEKLLEALRRALEKADGLDVVFHKYMPDKYGKYIVFCACKEHMDEMMEKVHEWFHLADENPHIYEVYSEDSETKNAFRAFKKDNSNHLKLLYCIDMLNEGIHIDDVDGVILIRPTISPIIYKQQIGRALSASKRKQPVIFDIVNNFESLYSIGAIEDEMTTALSYYRHSDGEGLQITEGFSVIDAMADCTQLFQQLGDTLSASWETMYNYAKSYYITYGNLEVSSRYRTEEGYSLGRWIQLQRRVREGSVNGILTEERIRLLDNIGMIWTGMRDTAWEKGIKEAQAYFAKHGNLNVKKDTVTDSGFCLGQWLARLRSYRRKNTDRSYLTEDRIHALDKLGMIWDVFDNKWQVYYQAAKEYFDQYGHLDIPANYVTEDGLILGNWIHKMRAIHLGRNNRGAELTSEQIAKLDSIGMQWSSASDRLWEKGYAEAKRYYTTYGNLLVSSVYVSDSGYLLGKWIFHQREKAASLSSERREKLNEIGMVWENVHEHQWAIAYGFAKGYFLQHGNLNMPSNYMENGINLGAWINTQRRSHKTGKLSSERANKLRDIGMRFV